MDVRRLFDLQPHGADVFVGVGPQYPWGGLYGGQIVAQALRGAALTVDGDFVAHSLRAYFIRRGDQDEPVRYEVDRIRNGRSFLTRRVVARQAVGAILNCEASFQRPEASVDVAAVSIPDVPQPDELEETSWSSAYERRQIPASALDGQPRTGIGRTAAWMRVGDSLGDDPVLHRCWLAFLSDDLPTDAVAFANPEADGSRWNLAYSASLDHTMWFHREPRVDEWHLHDFTCYGISGGRGLSIGQIFTADGLHVATIAQEVLARAAETRSTS